MAFVVADRVKVTVSAPGAASPITLGAAVTGFQDFSVIGDGNTTYYTIADQFGANWEVGIGTYTAAGTLLSRDTVLANSAGTTSLINFSSGTQDVFVTYPAGKAIFQNNLNSVVVAANTSSDALRITQTGSGNALLVEDSANPDATPFVVNAVGQVLFGNTTSISYQTMGLTYNSGKAQIAGADGNTSSQLIAQYNTGSTVAIPTIVFAKSKNATVGSHTIVGSGDSLGAVSYDGSDGTNFIEAARVWAQVDGTPGTNDMPGRLLFSTTADGASSPTERMRIDSSGNVGIGGAASAGNTLVSYKAMTGGGGYVYAFNNVATVNSDATVEAVSFQSYLSTQAASFTAANLRHFKAYQSTIGAGSTVTNQVGYFADASLTGATNNYGFYSDIASGTNRWNFYGNGTARNYFAGRLNLGDGTDVGAGIFANYNISGSGGAGYGIKQHNTVTSSVTSTFAQNHSVLYTQAAAFTLPAYKHYTAEQGTIGAGSTVTSQYGYIAEANLTGATNNFGFFSNIASGTGRWNFYAAGTAQNYFAGTTLIGTTTNTNTSTLVVNGTISQTVSSTQYLVVDQSDIGTGANEIPLNQYLGANAYVDTETPALNIGTGITTGTGTICRANGGLSGGIYRMTILIDLTGLNSGGAAGDIIGVNGTALPCYIAQLPAMTVLGGRMTCLETPAGGDTDIDLYSATEGTGVEDQAITALTETQIINAGAQSIGTVTYFAADPATNAYFYLVGQGTANATYTAGRFLIEIFGVQ